MRPIRSLQTRYGGVVYRSRTEARWALAFDALGIRFDYEPEGFLVRSGAYLPDFRLPDLRMFFEVKGQEPTAEEAAKCEELAIAAEYDFLIAEGAPDERFQIHWFDRGGRREGKYLLAQDRYVNCGFWLVDEDGQGFPIGPNRTLRAPAGPMLSGAIEEAISLAKSERFDGEQRRCRVPPLQHDPDRIWSDAA